MIFFSVLSPVLDPVLSLVLGSVLDPVLDPVLGSVLDSRALHPQDRNSEDSKLADSPPLKLSNHGTPIQSSRLLGPVLDPVLDWTMFWGQFWTLFWAQNSDLIKSPTSFAHGRIAVL